MDGADEPATLPEYRDNPFISALPPILSTVEALERLTDLPRFDESERRYPAHLRAHCVQRLGRYFDPLDRHLLLESRFSMLVRQGYLGRNPATGDYVRRLQNSHERHPATVEKALRRLPAYAAAGADVLYAPGLRTPDVSKAAVDAVDPKPLNLLVSSPVGLSVEQIATLGVRRISLQPRRLGRLPADGPHAGRPRALRRPRRGRTVRCAQ
ncbi:isocitrate lyase/phosphoenolpyruvate mutase family protein [Azospirillum brasilense]|uniref:isocitrate lyase/phosphoenolpyruvate mutase family protein n=1 Tax=Azospirillum brasilense TaxID=192 RepID=UPI00190DB352|nr:isocitrate lyase/phosphoenolpyruvate mutase family protein [Azospirillum brasilense]